MTKEFYSISNKPSKLFHLNFKTTVNHIVRVIDTLSSEALSSCFTSGNITNNAIQKQDINAKKDEVSKITELPKLDVNKLVNEATKVCARK
jgi:hypothetical protein